MLSVSHGFPGRTSYWGDVYMERSSARKRKMALAGGMHGQYYKVAMESRSQKSNLFFSSLPLKFTIMKPDHQQNGNGGVEWERSFPS
jgi:hypothetical protein